MRRTAFVLMLVAAGGLATNGALAATRLVIGEMITNTS